MPSLIEIRRILANLPRDDISEQAQVWLDFFSDTYSETKRGTVKFPTFTWNRDDLPDKLYLRESDGRYFLTSSDGHFFESITPTEELPFDKIANKKGLYFLLDGDDWTLKSYNPLDAQYTE